MQTLDELKQLEGRDAPTRHEAFREAPGDRPALPAWAGESLDDLELASLKQALGLDEAQWQAYTAQVRPEQEERKQTETQQFPPSEFSSCHPSQH